MFLFLGVITNVYKLKVYFNIKMVNQIQIQKLSKEQKEQYKEIKDFYKYFYECPACKRIYGADEKEIHLFCPKCISQTKNKTRKGY